MCARVPLSFRKAIADLLKQSFLLSFDCDFGPVKFEIKFFYFIIRTTVQCSAIGHFMHIRFYYLTVYYPSAVNLRF